MTDTLPLREQIARIIDGGAWQRHGFTGDPDWHPDDQRLEQRRSLAKADAITALLPSLPDGWVAVPEEPTEEIIEAMNAAYLSTRRHGVSGQTIEAVWRAKYGPEIVAYRAMLSARPTPPTEPPRGWADELLDIYGRLPGSKEKADIARLLQRMGRGGAPKSTQPMVDVQEWLDKNPPPGPLETER